jgi:GNAT superfamily N-acetyltransferase
VSGIRTAPLLVRSAAPHDLERLLELLDELRAGATPGIPWTRPSDERAAAVLDAILDEPGRSLLIAELEGELVGALDLTVHPNLTHGASPVAWIENVVVDATHRRRGIGSALMQEGIDRADAAGCYKVQLLSNDGRAPAHAFYASIGFRASATGFRRYLR